MDTAIFDISVGGIDVSESFNQLLINATVSLHANATADSASIILSDVDGQILLPTTGDAINIQLGWESTGTTQVFSGTVENVRSRGNRHDGRQLSISAKSFDTTGKAKEPLEFHKDKASLQDFMSDAAGKAGLSFQAQSAIGQIQRDYWSASTESVIHLGQRVAREVGASFKIVGSVAYMWPRNTPLFGAGDSGGTVQATWPGNLLEWDIVPIVSRPRFETARARWYDRAAAAWQEQTVATGLAGAKGIHTNRFIRADESEAKDVATNNQRSSEREAGSGSVVLVGQPAAQPEGICAVAGTRPGVDGSYRIDAVDHQLSRGGGFVTHLGLKQPQGTAGQDSRESEAPAP